MIHSTCSLLRSRLDNGEKHLELIQNGIQRNATLFNETFHVQYATNIRQFSIANDIGKVIDLFVKWAKQEQISNRFFHCTSLPGKFCFGYENSWTICEHVNLSGCSKRNTDSLKFLWGAYEWIKNRFGWILFLHGGYRGGVDFCFPFYEVMVNTEYADYQIRVRFPLKKCPQSGWDAPFD